MESFDFNLGSETVGVGSVEHSLVLKGLNPSQREAALKVQGPLMVLAGAGSGKTKMLTSRISHLVLDYDVKISWP
jgi:hypothetical protein